MASIHMNLLRFSEFVLIIYSPNLTPITKKSAGNSLETIFMVNRALLVYSLKENINIIQLLQSFENKTHFFIKI